MSHKKSAFAPFDKRNLIQEAEQIKAQIREVSNQLASLDLNLGASLRLNIKRREMDAYLCGLLFVLGEGTALGKFS